MFYPLTFRPIFKERVWGGRNLERLFNKPLPQPSTVPIGESWEITDRPEGVSEITNGPLAGRTLRWLMENHAGELLGNALAEGWFSVKRQADRLSIAIATKQAALKGRLAARQHINGQNHAVTPH